MKAVILGAGASYDSIYEFHSNPHPEDKKFSMEELNNHFSSIQYPKWRPPLAKDLFSNKGYINELLSEFPLAKSLSSLLNRATDIEEELEKIKITADRNNDELSLSKLISVQYYLQKLFRKVSENYPLNGLSNYEALISQAYHYAKRNNEEVIFIPFNYDTLTEQAITSVTRHTFESIDDYINGFLKVFKPHGSYNWMRISKGQNFKNLSSSHLVMDEFHYYNKEVLNTLDSDITIMNDTITWNSSNAHQLYCVPQIAIPLKSKSDFIFPTAHQDRLAKCLSRVTEILIIGWQANEKRFTDFLKEYLPPHEVSVTYITGSRDTKKHNLKEIFPAYTHSFYNQWAGINTKHDSTCVPPYLQGSFSGYIWNCMTGRIANNFFDL